MISSGRTLPYLIFWLPAFKSSSIKVKQEMEAHSANQKAVRKLCSGHTNANNVADTCCVKSPEAKAQIQIFHTTMHARCPEQNYWYRFVTCFRPSVAYKLILGFKDGWFSLRNQVIGAGNKTELLCSHLYWKHWCSQLYINFQRFGNNLLLTGHEPWWSNHGKPHKPIWNPWYNWASFQQTAEPMATSRQ